jgi:hypothetical protein
LNGSSDGQGVDDQLTVMACKKVATHSDMLVIKTVTNNENYRARVMRGGGRFRWLGRNQAANANKNAENERAKHKELQIKTKQHMYFIRLGYGATGTAARIWHYAHLDSHCGGHIKCTLHVNRLS